MVITANRSNDADSFSGDEAAIAIPERRNQTPRSPLHAYVVPLNKDQMKIARAEFAKRDDLPFLTLTEFAIFFFSSDPQLLERKRGVICIEFFMYREIHQISPLVEFYTGLPHTSAFCDINGMLQTLIFLDYMKWESHEKQGFMTHTMLVLMKLKLNMTDEELAERFKLDVYVVNMTLRLWIPALHQVLYNTCHSSYRYPESYNTDSYTKAIDIVEIRVESQDGCTETRRTVMAVRADSYFCFGSDVFSQYVPEDVCLRRCKFKGSTTEVDVVLTHPELLHVLRSAEIPCASITEEASEQIELAAGRISGFRILGAIPLEYASYASFIFKVCGALSNFKLSMPNVVDDEV